MLDKAALIAVLASIAIKNRKKISEIVGKIRKKKPKIQLSVKNPESLKGKSFEINKGYPKATGGDKIHKDPYVKATVGNKKLWVPLKGNPDLK